MGQKEDLIVKSQIAELVKIFLILELALNNNILRIIRFF